MIKPVAISAIALACFTGPILSAATSAALVASSGEDVRIDQLLGQLTLEEKVDLLGGVDWACIREIPKIKLPKLRMSDGPFGVSMEGRSTTFAGGIALASSWNPNLAFRVGTELGRDARSEGIHFLLGPGVNMYLSPKCGRNFEYFGEDPFLASRMAVGYIEGVQSQGVSATVKHFVANNSEWDRQHVDAIVDERTLREIYLPTFEAAVKEAKVGAVMDSYNLLNGVHLSQNAYANNTILKQEWGFDGLLMSDWVSTHDGVAAANGGLDLEMPSGDHMNRATLLPAIKQGKVGVKTIDDKVRRILRTALRFGWFDREQRDGSISRLNLMGKAVALQGAREGMVLLKNESNLLPLNRKAVKTLAVIGPNAYPAVCVAGGSGHADPFHPVSALEGIADKAGSEINVLYASGIPTIEEMGNISFSTAAEKGKPGFKVEYFQSEYPVGKPILTRIETNLCIGQASRNLFPKGTRSDRWTGYFTPQKGGDCRVFLRCSGEDSGHYRLFVDGKLVLDSWTRFTATLNQADLHLEAKPHKLVIEHRGDAAGIEGAMKLGVLEGQSLVDEDTKRMAAKADVVVIPVGFDFMSESESSDRTFGLPPGQDQLIRELSAVNRNIVVVINSGGGVDMSGWLDRVPAVIEAWYPGQEGGTALAELLFGDVNFSGRLPISMEQKLADNPSSDCYYSDPGSLRAVYKQGIFTGYRGFERNGTKPLFPFGFGLSYTSFRYDNLLVIPTGDARCDVSFDVTNTGSRAGSDVAQVYVHDGHAAVPRPPKELKGFAKVELQPGETKHVRVSLDGRAFSYYDVKGKGWKWDAGDFEILVGRSSADIQLKKTWTLPVPSQTVQP